MSVLSFVRYIIFLSAFLAKTIKKKKKYLIRVNFTCARNFIIKFFWKNLTMENEVYTTCKKYIYILFLFKSVKFQNVINPRSLVAKLQHVISKND